MGEDRSTSNILLRERNKCADGKRENEEEIKHVLTGEGFSDYREIILIQVLNPICICMRIFGLLWTGRYNMFHGNRYSFDLCTLHCCIVLFFAWFLLFRNFAIYESTDKYGSELLRKICYQLIDLQFACGITSNVYFKQKHIPSFIKLWENYKIKHGGVSFAKIKRDNTIKLVTTNVIILVISVVLLTYGLIKEPEVFAEYHLQVMKRLNIPSPFWLVVLVTILYQYLAFAWLQSLLYCLCINKNLREEFEQLSSQFSQELEGNKRFSSFKMKNAKPYKTQNMRPLNDNKNPTEHYRQRYMELCTLVSTFDDVISSYLLSIYLFSVPVIVIFVYILWGFDDSSRESFMLFLSSIVCLIFYVVVVISVTASSSSLVTAVSVIYAFYLQIISFKRS